MLGIALSSAALDIELGTLSDSGRRGLCLGSPGGGTRCKAGSSGPLSGPCPPDLDGPSGLPPDGGDGPLAVSVSCGASISTGAVGADHCLPLAKLCLSPTRSGPYLIRLEQNAGPAAALVPSIQSVQFNTLQYVAARRAVRELASDPATALPFCGMVAIKTNGATLATLARVSTAGLAVAAPAARRAQKNQESLLLDVGRVRRGRSWYLPLRGTGERG